MEFWDFYKLAAQVVEYEKLLLEETQRGKTSIGLNCQEVTSEEIVVADLVNSTN